MLAYLKHRLSASKISATLIELRTFKRSLFFRAIPIPIGHQLLSLLEVVTTLVCGHDFISQLVC